MAKTIVIEAAGPLTARGVPPKNAHTMPAKMAVVYPDTGLTPEASAIESDKGIATQATITPARRSFHKFSFLKRAFQSRKSVCVILFIFNFSLMFVLKMESRHLFFFRKQHKIQVQL